MRNIKLLFLGGIILLAFSCKDKKVEPEVNFEKKDIMLNLADNWIIPAYQDLNSKIDSLDSKWQKFKISNTQSDFDSVKSAWKSAYLSFENIKFVDFGPAADNGFSGALGTFPSDTSAIETNISAGSYDLTTISNIAAIGLPALDYLFFENTALADIQNQVNRKKYIDDLIQKMKGEITYVSSTWSTYRTTFIDGTGTSSTSPFSQLLNAFCKDFDISKNTKVGIPLGKQSLDIMRLEFLEARYSKISTDLLVENFKALRSVYSGLSGKGFDDYLVALDKQSLATNIQSRFDYLVSEPANWTSNLESMMMNSKPTIDNYYNYVAGTVVYLKTDMTSAFGVLITYQDNDGD